MSTTVNTAPSAPPIRTDQQDLFLPSIQRPVVIQTTRDKVKVDKLIATSFTQYPANADDLVGVLLQSDLIGSHPTNEMQPTAIKIQKVGDAYLVHQALPDVIRHVRDLWGFPHLNVLRSLIITEPYTPGQNLNSPSGIHRQLLETITYFNTQEDLKTWISNTFPDHTAMALPTHGKDTYLEYRDMNQGILVAARVFCVGNTYYVTADRPALFDKIPDNELLSYRAWIDLTKVVGSSSLLFTNSYYIGKDGLTL